MAEKFTFIFIGSRNCTLGNPNPLTGRHSIAGRIIVGSHPSRGVVGGRRVMRQFCLGLTVQSFNERLDWLLETKENSDQ